MKRRKVIAITVICASVLGLLAGTCSYMIYRFNHAGEGPEHVFPLAGDGALTDEQALSFSKEVMLLDHRFSPTLRPIPYGGNGSFVNRGDDPQYTTVSWYETSGRQWFVRLHHKDGKVVGISYPGH